MPLAVDTGQNLGTLRDQVKRFTAHNEKLKTNDIELKEAKRLANEAEESVKRTQQTWDHKIRLERSSFDQARQEDVERLQRLEKKASESFARIAALQTEIDSFKDIAAAAWGAWDPVSNHAATPAPPRASIENLSTLMKRLNLTKHLAVLEDEELDVPLLRSMGRAELLSNMASLGMGDHDAAKLANDLFGVDVS
jgi:FtsZ-binding cell division protein ZapB